MAWFQLPEENQAYKSPRAVAFLSTISAVVSLADALGPSALMPGASPSP